VQIYNKKYTITKSGFYKLLLKSRIFTAVIYHQLMSLILLLQSETIAEKMKEAPDKGYEIGVVIGTYLPLLLLFGFAWLMYYLAKKRNKDS